MHLSKNRRTLIGSESSSERNGSLLDSISRLLEGTSFSSQRIFFNQWYIKEIKDNYKNNRSQFSETIDFMAWGLHRDHPRVGCKSDDA